MTLTLYGLAIIVLAASHWGITKAMRNEIANLYRVIERERANVQAIANSNVNLHEKVVELVAANADNIDKLGATVQRLIELLNKKEHP